MKIIIVDGQGYIHRAYHALPPLTTSYGEQVNAIYGFIRMLTKIIKTDKPDYLAVCFDFPAPTFRHKQYSLYKSTRKKTDEELKTQIPVAKQVVGLFGVLSLEKEGYEADDLIATLVNRFEKGDNEIKIISSDKDLLQLVNSKVTVINEQKNIVFTGKEVETEFGVKPGNITDLLALCGDSSDNVPGVNGIGEKTAIKLISQFGNVDSIYSSIDSKPFNEQFGEKIKSKLLQNRESAQLSKQLVILDSSVEINVQDSEFVIKPVNFEEMTKFCRKYEFNKLLKEFIGQQEFSLESGQKPDNKPVEYNIIDTEEKLKPVLQKLSSAPHFAFEFISQPEDLLQGAKLNIALPDDDCYTVNSKELILQFKPYFISDKVVKYGYNIKLFIVELYKICNELWLSDTYFDVLLGAYLLAPGKSKYILEDIAVEFSLFNDKSVQLIIKLGKLLEQQLGEKNLSGLYKDLEIPVMNVLSGMEINGIKLDMPYLKQLDTEFSGKIAELTGTIYSIAGQEFNINSPKQLGFILFEKMKLPVIRKTKTGYSTDEEVLRALSPSSDIVKHILEYREIQKLKSTYIDGLKDKVVPGTERIHTTFNQAGTATGRLSSLEPNIQNIPIRTESGRKIRQLFIPGKGYTLVSTDYSQIDLRVLAHFSQDKVLCDAFNNGDDIHSVTAREIFNIPDNQEVVVDQRRVAKTINFGIVYGISGYGLSQQLGISPEQAEEYISSYFQKYSGVKTWNMEALEQARKDMYVTTLLGRKRFFPEILAKNNQIRSFNERAAINTIIQGTAADIIKVAMVNIDKWIKSNKLNVKMLIQVHDELLFEIPEQETKETSKIIKQEMESAVKLNIPVIAEIKQGKNWNTMEKL